jgi:hypothetical protein
MNNINNITVKRGTSNNNKNPKIGGNPVELCNIEPRFEPIFSVLLQAPNTVCRIAPRTVIVIRKTPPQMTY